MESSVIDENWDIFSYTKRRRSCLGPAAYGQYRTSEMKLHEPLGSPARSTDRCTSVENLAARVSQTISLDSLTNPATWIYEFQHPSFSWTRDLGRCHSARSDNRFTFRPRRRKSLQENQAKIQELSKNGVQLSLPKLPVPELQETMDKYLSLLQPILSPQAYSRTQCLVSDFCQPGGAGPQLQDYLLKRHQATNNWATEWWLQDMYLNIRSPLIINSNPGAVFSYQDFPSRRHQIRFAAKFIRGMLDFKHLLDTRTLPVERCKHNENGQPLCMEQHYRLFSSYREPGRSRDVLRTDTGSPGSDYIVVACNNQFYKVDVQRAGHYIAEVDLCVQISRVLAVAHEKGRVPEVGILTTQARHVWAEQRTRLQQDPTNRTALHVLENCLFLLCLDTPTNPSRDSTHANLATDMSARTHHLIHGQGVDNNTCNRWMDKTIQVIISEDGTCGINMEHSVAEGIALGHMIEHAFNFMARPQDSPPTSPPADMGYPTYLRWNLSTQSLADIRQAKEDADRLIEDLDLCVFRFESYGRDFIKQHGMSPDAYIQLALQLTYYKIHRKLTSTYESASIRRFRQGRVDVIRANSPAALAWVKAMLGQSKDQSDEEKMALFTEAIQWQQDYTLDTVLGHGIDLHLLGLREAAVELQMPTPAIFKDSSYKEANHFRLSTSQVPTVSDYWMGYGAVVADGYGCCYNPHSDQVVFSVSSFRSCPDTSSSMFIDTLESSLLQMAELCSRDAESIAVKCQ